MQNNQLTYEEAVLRRQRRGRVMMTVGKVLLWMDLLLLCFVYVGLRGGSDFWLAWVVIEGALGFGLLGFGLRQRNHARRQLDQMAHKRAA